MQHSWVIFIDKVGLLSCAIFALTYWILRSSITAFSSWRWHDLILHHFVEFYIRYATDTRSISICEVIRLLFLYESFIWLERVNIVALYWFLLGREYIPVIILVSRASTTSTSIAGSPTTIAIGSSVEYFRDLIILDFALDLIALSRVSIDRHHHLSGLILRLLSS